MLIDWFTVAAQMLNFLVLVWLLKRFLYKPILAAIEAREGSIAAKLADAAAKETQAKADAEAFAKRSKAFDDQRAAALSKAVADAGAERDRLVALAQQQADALRSQQSADLQHAGAALAGEIARTATAEVFAISRKALAELATVGLEAQMADVFSTRIRTLDGPARGTFGAALAGSSAPAMVSCAFALADAQRASIQKSVNETFSAAVPLEFATAPESICGIEIAVNGEKICWSIKEYLDSLEERVDKLLDAPPAGAATVEAK